MGMTTRFSLSRRGRKNQNRQTLKIMKNTIHRSCCSALALISLGASLARAEFLTPTVPAPETFAVAALKSAGPVALAATLTVVNKNDDGAGSLRAAIAAAAPGDTIQFALPLPAIITLKSALTIDKDLTIIGPGPLKLTVTRSTAKKTPSFRVLNVNAGVVTITGLTLSNGRALNPNGASDNLGGGILSFGSLTVSNCVITKNEAPTENGGVGYGGGIFALGPLTVVDSTISLNKVTGAGGGISTFYSSGFILDRCTVSENIAFVQGGGVNFQGSIGSLKNSTISGNQIAANGAGSGLLHLTFPGGASGLSVSSCTITRNRGGTNAVVLAALPGSQANLTWLRSTIIADNDTRNFSLVGAPILISFGHNLDSDGTSGLVNGVNGDIIGTLALPIDARLGGLLANGGPTRTHALLAGSPAVDTGACVDANNAALFVDQRSFPRPSGVSCDIGAFENQPPTVTCPTNATIDCGKELSATVNDPDGDALAIVWSVDGTDVQTNLLGDVHPPAPRSVKLKVAASVGAHTIGVRVWDGKADVVSCSSSVTVLDTKAPSIDDVKADPTKISSDQDQFVPVKITVKATDCSSFTCRIIGVTSSDPTGITPDWIVTGDLTLSVRTQASDKKDRIYTITVECRDAAGNASQKTVTVTIQKGSGHGDDNGSHSGSGSQSDSGSGSGSHSDSGSHPGAQQ